MRRPGRVAPGVLETEAVPGRSSDFETDPDSAGGIGSEAERVDDERAVARLLGAIDEGAPSPPDGLSDRVGRRVRDRIALHDLIEIATRAFARTTLLPVAERLAALIARSRSGGRPSNDRET